MTYEDPVALAKIVWKDLTTGVNNEYVLMEGATATIGRSKHNDICVPERHVSRRHAVIHFRDGIFMLSDLGSANGTYVNDRKLDDPFPLAGGDVIRLFVPELQFIAGVTDEERETASASGTLIVPSRVNRPHLSITSGIQEGTEFALLADIMTIGRVTAEGAFDISLDDRAISRPHARMERLPDSDQWRIIDMESANGTRVNGQFVDSESGCVLHDGDVLVLGATMLLFRSG